jgi:hypothetical protein
LFERLLVPLAPLFQENRDLTRRPHPRGDYPTRFRKPSGRLLPRYPGGK